MANDDARAPDAPATPTEPTPPDAARAEANPVAEVAPPKAAAAPLEKPKVYCRDRARALVHKYAIAGTAFAAIPIPMATSPGLTALETHLIYWIGRTYDDAPTHPETLMIASGLELASVGLRTVAREAAGLVPVVGWVIKAAIAGASIEAIGNVIIHHFEGKHPNKLC